MSNTASLVIPELDQISALAEAAADQRLPRPQLAAELAATGVALAQKLTEEVLTHDLSWQLWIEADSAADADCVTRAEQRERRFYRHYEIELAVWKSGRIGRRIKHEVPVLTRLHGLFSSSLFWIPAAPDQTWNTDNPHIVKLKNLGPHNCSNDMFSHQPRLADADMLATLSQDAIPMMEGLLARATNRTDHLANGAEAADRALGLLQDNTALDSWQAHGVESK